MTDVLFREGSLHDIIRNIKEKGIIPRISKMDENEIFAKSEDELVESIKSEFTIHPIKLDRDSVKVEHEETDLYLSDLYYGTARYYEDSKIRGHIIRIYVPFNGDPNLFKYRGTSLKLSGNSADIVKNEENFLVLSYKVSDISKFEKEIYEKELNEIEENLNYQEKDIDNYNAELPRLVKGEIEKRKHELETIRRSLDSLGVQKKTADHNTIVPNRTKPDYKIKAKENKLKSQKSSEKDKRDVFLCHAGLDKSKYVVHFARELENHNISYWLDEAEIKWGDNLQKSINDGLRSSKFVIIFLSDNFLGRDWPEKELYAALGKEDRSGHTVVLPIMIGNIKSILERYPLLEAKIYVHWSEGIASIIEKLKKRLR